MIIQDIFASDVTRDIPPVIYFHEQKPEKLAAEVSEYIITGGYAPDDPRRKRIADGIHEQYVRLLGSLASELDKPGGAELPACWISGFYGSGKSSFAKLLGLSLDHRELPGGKLLSEALLERDDSPRREELRRAWEGLRGKLDSLAVVFDIGAVARDDEHIHTAAKRQLQERLGYCPVSHAVADYELRLELDGKWEEFLELAGRTLQKPWSQACREALAEDHFSEVMGAMFPTRYEDPVAWLDTRAGVASGAGTSVEETVREIESMLDLRAPGKTLFLVVDEVSQYIHQNDHRMLKLQTFVEALGQRLKGRVWLLATGQQKLEEDLEGGNLGKLKDRFPDRLRVHLAPTNIRDVVHKRLLKKAPGQEEALGQLFDLHRPDLQLYGYQCEGITRTDFLEVYPMLPGHVDLLMQITSNLRARSSRVKGDDHAIRGLLQLLGELFRELKLGERPLGSLLTLDQIYDVQYTALDADVQNSMARLQAHEDVMQDELALRAAKVVALLELIQDQEPTTPGLVARCLYAALGAGSLTDPVEKALQKLKDLSFLAYSEKQGYKIQSSADQEWSRERESHPVTGQAVSEVVREKLRDLVGAQTTRPRLRNRPFPLKALFSDTRGAREESLASPNDAAVVVLDFQYCTRAEEAREEPWLKESDTTLRRDRLVWVSGATSPLEARARDLLRSRHMVQRYASRLQSLPEARRRLLFEEQGQLDRLEAALRDLVAEAFSEGELYFRARKLPKDRYAGGFAGMLQGAAEEVLPVLYEHFVDLAVTEGEMKQLLEFDLKGVTSKFLDSELGLLELDSGKYVATCKGEVPTRIKDFINGNSGTSGHTLLAHFGGPPCGFAPDLVRASVLGLLRGGFVHLRTALGAKITSVRDPDVQDLFRKDKDFKQAEILPGEDKLSPRDKVALHKFFSESLERDVERDNEHLADAVFQLFPAQSERLRRLHEKLNRLPRRPALGTALGDLQVNLEKCLQSRRVEDTLLAVRSRLDKLRDGLEELGIWLGDLTDEAVEQVRAADRALSVELEQLRQVGLELSEERDRLEGQLGQPCPWRDVASVTAAVQRVRERYREARQEYLDAQERLAEELREQVKIRPGFAGLDPDRADHVLRPLREALCDTTPEAISPVLAILRDSTPARLREAADEAHRRLDEALEDVHVVQVRVRAPAREFASADEVEVWLSELRDRLLAQLKDRTRVRVVLK